MPYIKTDAAAAEFGAIAHVIFAIFPAQTYRATCMRWSIFGQGKYAVIWW